MLIDEEIHVLQRREKPFCLVLSGEDCNPVKAKLQSSRQRTVGKDFRYGEM